MRKEAGVVEDGGDVGEEGGEAHGVEGGRWYVRHNSVASISILNLCTRETNFIATEWPLIEREREHLSVDHFLAPDCFHLINVPFWSFDFTTHPHP